MAFKLPELPYSKDALSPHISARTLEFHYGKHHQGYVNKLNAAVDEGAELFLVPPQEYDVAVEAASDRLEVVSVATLVFLGVLGALGARTGGADILRPTARVMFWGALAMAITAGVGRLFGTVAA